jgi:hypothetical protein
MTVETFLNAYAEELTKAVSEFPDKYLYAAGKVPEVVGKTKEFLSQYGLGAVSIDGIAWKRTCKRFGIGHTKKDIQRFLDNHV